MTFTELETKRLKDVPGVGRYDLDKAINRITLGARKGYSTSVSLIAGVALRICQN